MCRRNVFYLEMVHQSFLWRLSMQESQRLYLCLHRPFQAMSTQQHVRTVRCAIYYLKKEDNFELTEHFVQELIRQIKAHKRQIDFSCKSK